MKPFFSRPGSNQANENSAYIEKLHRQKNKLNFKLAVLDMRSISEKEMDKKRDKYKQKLRACDAKLAQVGQISKPFVGPSNHTVDTNYALLNNMDAYTTASAVGGVGPTRPARPLAPSSAPPASVNSSAGPSARSELRRRSRSESTVESTVPCAAAIVRSPDESRLVSRFSLTSSNYSVVATSPEKLQLPSRFSVTTSDYAMSKIGHNGTDDSHGAPSETGSDFQQDELQVCPPAPRLGTIERFTSAETDFPHRLAAPRVCPPAPRLASISRFPDMDSTFGNHRPARSGHSQSVRLDLRPRHGLRDNAVSGQSFAGASTQSSSAHSGSIASIFADQGDSAVGQPSPGQSTSSWGSGDDGSDTDFSGDSYNGQVHLAARVPITMPRVRRLNVNEVV